MSQYAIVQVVGGTKKKYVFGWDQPLMSFFLQVHDLTKPEDDEERIVTWLGADASTRMYEVEDLTREARKCGLYIPYRIRVRLHGERDDGR